MEDKKILPSDLHLPINLLASVFNRTTATYKYYWFLSILELVAQTPNRLIFPIRSILSRMIGNVWYPVHYYRISFGLADLLRYNTIEIQKQTKLPIDEDKEKLYQNLINNTDHYVVNLIMHFGKYVPFRFLSPWFPGANNREVVNFSSDFKNCCLYKVDIQKDQIQINPNWSEYLVSNNRILRDFCYWNLILYLQAKNPNVPDIANKLIKPVSRESMTRQRRFWDTVFMNSESPRCIYTGKPLLISDYVLEHFIPWSFVSHNLIWNLVPVTQTVNSSKSNRLPQIDRFLEPFVNVQKRAVQTVYRLRPRDKILEDYLVLGESIPKILTLSMLEFRERYRKLLTPLVQIAENMGYEYWRV
ncbi:MAG: HNH endonuclease [Bacteroidales bacterium]|nr:HNH endonuclease [Bacteroidales bacterium]